MKFKASGYFCNNSGNNFSDSEAEKFTGGSVKFKTAVFTQKVLKRVANPAKENKQAGGRQRSQNQLTKQDNKPEKQFKEEVWKGERTKGKSGSISYRVELVAAARAGTCVGIRGEVELSFLSYFTIY